MSQYPSPFPGQGPQPAPPPPQYPYPPLGYAPVPPYDPRAPARRAALMMFTLGGLGLACGVCMGVAAFAPLERMIAEAARQGQTPLPSLPAGMTWHDAQAQASV